MSYSQPPGDPAGHVAVSSTVLTRSVVQIKINCKFKKTRSSADADNRLDAFSGQSRSTNMVPFHM